MKKRDRRYPTNPDRKSTEMTKLIVSEFVSGPLEEARKLKETAPPARSWSTARLAHALLEADLVDDHRAMVHPIFVADGLRMVPDPAEMKKLEPKDAIAYGSGVALPIYEPAES
jgi:dihydrofolate reductase